MNYRIGADIGGTFTDLILVDDAGATFQVGKVLTTPERPDDAVLAGVKQVLSATGVSAGAVSHLVHGTTLFANALIERKGAKTALVTTRGFRDAIEIGREHRYDMYDLFMERPKPLAPRFLRFEVDERLLVDGSVARPLDDNEVRALVESLRSAGVEAIGVCLIHSYVNDRHERRVGAILRDALPEVAITLSCDLVPEIREYDRASTTLANVYVQGLAERYLGRLRERLTGIGMNGELFIMQSNGGLCEVNTAARYPVRLIESGPAAGALAAAHYGNLLGHEDLLSFDMGGTTAKACFIVDGEPLIASEYEVDRQYQFKKGSGLPVKVPVIEMIEIGTGGGSLARIDALGRIQIGPQSAGAEPGPVCYGLGGAEPTVTDADLVLGYLDPEFFLGGEMTLDREAAEGAITNGIAKPLNLGIAEAAWAIHQLANESMASAVRIHAIERGKDVEKFPIFAFGGAGPVHAYGVARILRSAKVIYPLGAGVISAVGFLTAPLSFDFVRTFPGPLDSMDWEGVNQIFEQMEAEGRAILSRTIPAEKIDFRRSADLRYRKQGYEVRTPIPSSRLSADRKDKIKTSFEQVYRAIYGHLVADAQIEVVSWRVVAQGPRPNLKLPSIDRAAAGAVEAAVKKTRSVYMPEVGGFLDVPVYDRYALPPEARLVGPAIVEERESTVVVGQGAEIRIDGAGNLIAKLQK